MDLLLLVDLRDVAVHDLGRELHVADAVVRERLRVGLPHRDRVRHELTHGGLEVIVAHDPAGDAGRTRPDVGLVDHEDVLAGAEPLDSELPRRDATRWRARGSRRR